MLSRGHAVRLHRAVRVEQLRAAELAKGGAVHVERTEEGGPAHLARVLEIEAEAGEGVRRPRR